MGKYAEDIKLYTADVDEAAIEGIVKHLGIALRSRDASLVACTDPDELNRVRESFLKKKLERTDKESDLDDAIKEICTKMKNDKSKSRVTFYYLLAEKYGKLSLFTK
jgi:hypothetical protein